MWLLALMFVPAGATGLAGKPITVPTRSLGYPSFPGDLDGDGYDDIAFPNDTFGSITVFWGGPAGPVASTVVFTASEPWGGSAKLIDRATDTDGDGDSELLLHSHGFAVDGYSVVLDVDSARSASELWTSASEHLVSLGDWNGDGFDDVGVVRTRSFDEPVVLLPGSSSGTLMLSETEISATWQTRFAGDTDGDGKDDICAWDPDTDGSVVLDSDGPIVELDWYGELAGDRDGDGYEDMYVFQSGVGYEVWYGAAAGLGGRTRSLPPQYDPGRLHGDADGDGRDDGLFFDLITDEVVLHLDESGPPDAAFSVPRDAGVGWAGDVNGDGLSDVFVDTGWNLDIYLGDDSHRDGDGDGFGPSTDCDDTNSDVFPGATEVVDDGVDSDCDGFEACLEDADGDGAPSGEIVLSENRTCTDEGEIGVGVTAIDCDDADASISPFAAEIVDDGMDQDCNGLDACWLDSDEDGFHAGVVVPAVAGTCGVAGLLGANAADGDCDDQDPDAWPGNEDDPDDGIDQDCDGVDGCRLDRDGDGFAGEETGATGDPECLEGTTTELDCDDEDASRSPGAEDIADDGIDQDCDGEDAGVPEVGAADDERGCGCSSSAAPTSGVLLVGLVGLVLRRRRNR